MLKSLFYRDDFLPSQVPKRWFMTATLVAILIITIGMFAVTNVKAGPFQSPPLAGITTNIMWWLQSPGNGCCWPFFELGGGSTGALEVSLRGDPWSLEPWGDESPDPPIVGKNGDPFGGEEYTSTGKF